MDTQERCKILRRITSRKLIFDLHDGLDTTHRCSYSDPSVSILVEADYEYELVYRTNQGEVFTLEESFEILKKKGEWSQKLEDELKALDGSISNFQKQAQTFRFHKNRQRALLKEVKRLEERQLELTKLKYSLSSESLENLAATARHRYIVKNCVEIRGHPELLEKPDVIDQLIVLISTEDRRITEKVIRKIARTSPFRGMWRASRESGNTLLSCSTSEMSDLQQILTMWAFVYDYAYQHMERPPDEIIDSDEDFDAWYKSTTDSADTENRKRYNSSKVVGAKGGAGEVFIPADEEGAKEVYAMNSPQAQAQVRERQKFLQKKGISKESQLPDVKRDVTMKARRETMERKTRKR